MLILTIITVTLARIIHFCTNFRVKCAVARILLGDSGHSNEISVNYLLDYSRSHTSVLSAIIVFHLKFCLLNDFSLH